ncbi:MULTISPECIES: hypothetical protein [Brenneria]|uniref:hypothetical protein n=1 Tax=Brenneria TaxID=71655 RepID=UPI00022F82DC|nr:MULTISPECIES: hypothetical protein [Brenneria]EHD23243.1 hypothetical protein BrE312_3906 [Brenneria sp. EniD312]
MTIKKRIKFASLAAITLALSAISQGAVAGTASYSSDVAMPTIYSKNFWYNVPSRVIGAPSQRHYYHRAVSMGISISTPNWPQSSAVQ